MSFQKNFLKALIWAYTRLSSLLRSEVTIVRTQSKWWNLFTLVQLGRLTSLENIKNFMSFQKNFQKLSKREKKTESERQTDSHKENNQSPRGIIWSAVPFPRFIQFFS